MSNRITPRPPRAAGSAPPQRLRCRIAGARTTPSDGKPTARWPYVVLAAFLACTAPAVAAKQWQPVSTLARTAAAFAERVLRQPDARIEVRVEPLDPRLRLPRCSAALSGFLPAAGTRVLRPNTVVGVRCEGLRHWKVYVPVRVSLFREVLITSRAVTRGAVLTAADVRLAERDVAGLRAPYFTDPAELEHRVARRALAEGMLLTADALDAQRVIKRGQAVTLLAQRGGLEVRMRGKALTEGRINQRIRVENLSSKRVVEGIVRSAQLVEIVL